MLTRRGFLAVLGLAASTGEAVRALQRGARAAVPKPAAPVIEPAIGAGALQPGDVVTIEGVYARNPQTLEIAEYIDPASGKSYRFLQQFMVRGTNPDGSFQLWPTPDERQRAPGARIRPRSRSTVVPWERAA